MKKSAIFLLGTILCLANVNTAFAKNVDDKIKEFIDDFADTLKEVIDKLGDDLNSIQKYLENYHWKGIIQDEATSGMATLKHLQLNGHPRVVAVHPGERIEGVVQCTFDREKCSAFNFHRVALGIKKQGAQTTIGNVFGIVAGESIEQFVLIAPSEPGFHQIRFRVVESLFETNALNAWTDADGKEPDGTTTIGLIYVKK